MYLVYIINKIHKLLNEGKKIIVVIYNTRTLICNSSLINPNFLLPTISTPRISTQLNHGV